MSKFASKPVFFGPHRILEFFVERHKFTPYFKTILTRGSNFSMIWKDFSKIFINSVRAEDFYDWPSF